VTGVRDYLEGAALLACAEAGLSGPALLEARDSVAVLLEAQIRDEAQAAARRLLRATAEEDLWARAVLAWRRWPADKRVAAMELIGQVLGGPFKAQPRRALRALMWVPAVITARGGLATDAAARAAQRDGFVEKGLRRRGLIGWAPGGVFVWDIDDDRLAGERWRGLEPGADGVVAVSASAADWLREVARDALFGTPEERVASRKVWRGCRPCGWAEDGEALRDALPGFAGRTVCVGRGAGDLAEAFEAAAKRRAA
jgi:hypothetical protein